MTRIATQVWIRPTITATRNAAITLSTPPPSIQPRRRRDLLRALAGADVIKLPERPRRRRSSHH